MVHYPALEPIGSGKIVGIHQHPEIGTDLMGYLYIYVIYGVTEKGIKSSEENKAVIIQSYTKLGHIKCQRIVTLIFYLKGYVF